MSGEHFEAPAFSGQRQAFDTAFLSLLQRLIKAAASHWLVAMNLLTGLLAAMAFVAPLMVELGLNLPARLLYLFYSTMCHQLPQRSYFVFGYQVAQCQRNTAIYGALFVGGVAFAFLRDRVKPLDWRLYGLLILPMAVDGFTQLFGWRESNWELRTVTGALFGFASIWLTFPRIDEQLRAVKVGARERVFKVVLYGKEECSLCDKAKVVLERLRADYSLEIEEVDITSDEELTRRYQYLIPVIRIDGRVAAVSKVSEVWLRRKLDEMA